MPVKTTEIKEIQELVTELQERVIQVPDTVEDCHNRSYDFRIFEGGVEKAHGYIRPNLRILNLEDQIGFFRVYFSYREL